ncbi:TRAFAC clade GTPase domain-containing protein [Spirillospora sp. NBC_01491]|uniref:TRAFAC clade GTPase domain-containing protein n=1 Tax=Spirillospora sp. NBC_01491 TaxID=2976007 RepID=UPI002E33FC2C|nr:hypothetical protein [Spirillospora sp. NBC_01491]
MSTRFGTPPAPARSGDGMPMGCGCVLGLIVLWVVAVLALPAIMLIGAFFVAYSLYAYLRRLASVMGVGPGADPKPVPPPPGRADGRAEPAYTHYLFGPALIDLRHAARVAVPAPAKLFVTYDAQIRRVFGNGGLLLWPFGIVVWLGMAAGVGTGLAAIGVLCVVQFAVVAVLALAVISAGQALRAVDSGVRRIRGIRTSCPSCHQRVPYPSYECPGKTCGRRHRDVRPGRYGVLRRRCACGTMLRTLLLTGTGDGRMTAHCPHCDEPMSRGAGTVPEIVIPVLGAATTGKTRLMTALVMGLVDGAGRDAGGADGARDPVAEFADDQSAEAYRGLADKLRAGVHTWKTIKVKDAPLRAYSLHVRPSSGRPRLLHVFDAPGEFVGRSELLRELRYIKTARTFLLTLDPLSIDAVWDSLDPGERARSGRLRSDAPPDFVFGQLVENIQGLGAQTGRARLAVALTKDDLVRGSEALAGLGGGSDEIRDWLEGPAGFDGMVRLMRRSFAEVRFFRTSAWLDGGEVDAGVLDLAGWILAGEGLRVRHPA